MRSFLLSLLLFASFGLGAQTALREQLDSLKKAIRQSTYYDSSAVFVNGQKAIRIAQKLKDFDEEALIYQYYGNFFYFSYDLKRAEQFYKRSIEIAGAHNNDKLVNSTKIRLAFVLSETDLLAAEKEFQKLLKESIDYKYLENATEIYNGLGNIYDSRQMKDQSLKYYIKGLKTAEQSGNKYHQSMILNNIGLIKFGNEQVDEAEKDFKEALLIIQGLDEDRLALNLNNNLGLVNKEQGDYKESVKYYLNTLKNARKLGFPQARGVAFLNLSDSYLGAKDYPLSHTYADSAIALLRNFKEWDYLGMAYLIKSRSFRETGNPALAHAYVDSVFQLQKVRYSPTDLMNAHRELADIYSLEQDYKKALYHSDRYHQMKDSLSSVANKDELAQLQVIYGKEKVETALENEKNRNDLLEKENQLKQSRIQMIITSSVLILILLSGFLYIRYMLITKRQQKEFTQNLIENIDQERSRISKDLHDDIGQSLSVIKSKINLFNSGKTPTIQGLDADVGMVIDQTRNISHALHPSFITKLGLERSLVSLTEKTQQHTGLICSLSIDDPIEDIPVEQKTQIYRILQECINNTIKHAKATALKISFKHSGSGLEMIYQDNGIGLTDNLSQKEGIGLLTIRERAALINARVTVGTGGSKGYKLQLFMSKSEPV